MERLLIKDLLTWKTSSTRKPLILQGARQTGKTYLLKEFGKRHYREAFYLNFEDDPHLKELFSSSLQPKDWIEALSISVGKSYQIESDLIILDEIQVGGRALTALKYVYENLRDAHVIAAGSLLGVGLNEASFPVGKVQHLNLYPLNFSEFLLALGENLLYEHLQESSNVTSSPIHRKIWPLFKDYLITGGLPECVLEFRNNKEDRFHAYQSVRKEQTTLINQYLSDVTKHSGKVNAMHIERVLKSIPLNLARETATGSKRYRFKEVIPNNNRYEAFIGPIHWLEKAGLVYKIPIVHKATHPLLAYSKENIFKLYLFDIGILGALAGIPPEQIYNYDYGSVTTHPLLDFYRGEDGEAGELGKECVCRRGRQGGESSVVWLRMELLTNDAGVFQQFHS